MTLRAATAFRRALLVCVAGLACACTPEESDAEKGSENLASGQASTAADDPFEEEVTEGDVELIPAAYIGIWDYMEGTCNPASDLRLEIDRDQLIYYESAGEVLEVTPRSDGIAITMAMTGEGESWETTETYRLVEGGDILESDLPAPGGEGNLKRKKCEAEKQ